MMSIRLLIAGLIILTLGCSNPKELSIHIERNTTKFDSLYIIDVITEKILVQISLTDSILEHKFRMNEATVGAIIVKGTELTYLTIIEPKSGKFISVDSVSLQTKSLGDSLVNFIWKNGNEMFTEHYQEIFVEDNPDNVRRLFDSLIFVRAKIIRELSSSLTNEEIDILEYQNSSRAYSFLFYYGRWMKNYPPDNRFFDFIDKIDNENIYTKTLPNNLLYKYEIQFLRKNDSIADINTFLDFIETQTISEDLQDYLKAIYIKEVIVSPSYWKKHRQLFNTESIKRALDREKNNLYAELLISPSSSFFSSQKGEKAFDFTAQKSDGTALKLSDLMGKLVLIDTWATWCGPCIEQRPDIIQLAKDYESNSDIAILMISVDSSIDKWKKYVSKTNPEHFGIELYIEDGMNSEFGDKFLIKSIPKYILIDAEGIIINSDLNDPSYSMEKMIIDELKRL